MREKYIRLPTRIRNYWNLARPRQAFLDCDRTTAVEAIHGGGEPAGHCFLLHGWHSSPEDLAALERRLRACAGAERWWFWRVTYDSHWKSFARTARELMTLLSRQPHDFSGALLFCYSMGGLVARQMVAYGFPCSCLVSICSPHEGLAPWVPLPDPGSLSLAAWSPHLKRLNSSKEDRIHRERYHFYALTYDHRHPHDDDGLVTKRSALGASLGSVGSRSVIRLKYSSWPGTNPHWRGLDPRYVAPALQRCAVELARL